MSKGMGSYTINATITANEYRKAAIQQYSSAHKMARQRIVERHKQKQATREGIPYIICTSATHARTVHIASRQAAIPQAG